MPERSARSWNDGPLFCIIRTEGSIGPLPYATEVTVYQDRPRLDFRTTVEVHGQTIGATDVPAEWEGKDEPVVQDGKLMVHFTPGLGRQAMVAQDFPFSVGETRRRDINAGCWVDVSDGERGMTLANRGTMGYRLGRPHLEQHPAVQRQVLVGRGAGLPGRTYTLEYSVAFMRAIGVRGTRTGPGWSITSPRWPWPATPREGYLHPGANLPAVSTPRRANTVPNLVVSALYTNGTAGPISACMSFWVPNARRSG